MRPFKTIAMVAVVLIGAATYVSAQGAEGYPPPEATQQPSAEQPSAQPQEAEQPSAQPQAPPPQTSAAEPGSMEAEVLSKMHQANQMEIKGGELAISKASDPRVRNYGDLLVKDHKVADKMIQDLAAKQGIQLTEAMPKNEQEQMQMDMQKQTMADLESLSGAEFDLKFAQFNKQAHDMAVQMTSSAANELKPGPVQMLVSRMVPILKQHDTLAEHLGQQRTASR